MQLVIVFMVGVLVGMFSMWLLQMRDINGLYNEIEYLKFDVKKWKEGAKCWEITTRKWRREYKPEPLDDSWFKRNYFGKPSHEILIGGKINIAIKNNNQRGREDK